VTDNDTHDWRSYLGPKYWLTWCGFSFLWLASQLPLHYQRFIGCLTGYLLYYVSGYRRHIADVNLSLCFPELDHKARIILLRRVFEHYGMGIIETAQAWWGSDQTLLQHAQLIGVEHLKESLEKGQGVLLINAHFTTLEAGVRLLSSQIPFDFMYRKQKNDLFDYFLKRGRSKNNGLPIDRRDVRGILRSLKNNHAVWYGPDQDYGRKHSVFAPFMGINAATVTATARLAKLSGAAVVPYFVHRSGHDSFVLKVLPALNNFPGGDPVKDAAHINQLIEAEIREYPHEYLWLHRRFKTRPEGERRPY